MGSSYQYNDAQVLSAQRCSRSLGLFDHNQAGAKLYGKL